MLTRRDFSVAVIAAALTLTCVSFADDAAGVLDSTAWQWKDLVAKKTDVGERREVVRQPTRTLDELEMHITTLNPHVASHPPHTHANEEMVIVKEGTVEALVNGTMRRLGPGSVIFNASNELHAIRNVGTGPATYHVINWHTPATPRPASGSH